MQQVLEITGMHCNGCVNRVARALKTLTPNVTVSLEPPQAVLDVAQPLPVEQLSAAVSQAGDYAVKLKA
jgi:copper chaperone CopZ